MKLLFAGPTLYGTVTPGCRVAGTDIVCLPPAQQGDIARAVLQGATVIGLVDGRYEDVAAPWHKEILYALDQGVRMFGAASMGALRAAECAPFGMVPVGVVAEGYIGGDLTDDADVAQIHGPPELGCLPLSEALVNIEATRKAALDAGALSSADARRLMSSAKRIFFKDRTLLRIVELAGFSGSQAVALIAIFKAHWRDIKREDATALVEVMLNEPADRRAPPQAWTFRRPTAWRRFMADLQGSLQETR